MNRVERLKLLYVDPYNVVKYMEINIWSRLKQDNYNLRNNMSPKK